MLRRSKDVQKLMTQSEAGEAGGPFVGQIYDT